MRKIILFTIIMIVAVAAKLAAQDKGSYKNILDWTYWQPEIENYEMNFEKDTESANQNIFTIKSVKSKIKGFGSLGKSVKSNLYFGKTVKMTAYVKSEKVKSWAGLWMRVDYYTTGVLAFDNMENRPIKGSTNWTKYEIVLFVPKDATSISYGVLLDGTGQIWFKDVTLEVIEDSVPETGSKKGREHKEISFEVRAKAIADQIKKITEDEKKALKIEIDSLDNQVSKGIISKEKGEELKLNKAKLHAANIETNVGSEENKLSQLVQDRVDGKIETEKDKSTGAKFIIGNCNNCDNEDRTIINLTSMKVYHGQKDVDKRQSKRTTSQFVFAFGLNNTIADGDLQDSKYKFTGSHFYEWGLTYNSRLLKNNNLLHAKYGLSVMYNNIRPTDNRSFVVNEEQTDLVENAINLKESRFRNVYLVAPVHLEFDFSKEGQNGDKRYFRTHKGFRLGFGGYAGINVKSKQILKFEDNDYKTTQKTKGDFNVNNFIYGLSTYIGYKETSLYLKYDLSPLFQDNIIKENNISLGIRFDLN